MAWVMVGAAAITVVGGAINANNNRKAAKSAAQGQVNASNLSIAEQQRASAEGQKFLEPFAELGQTGLDQSSFLTDPQQQFSFLQNNPLFDLSLQNANRQTQNLAAARGRLSAGDTFQQLSNNTLLSAAPLITDQKRSIQDLINLGSGTAQTQANVAIGQGSNIANLLTNQGNAQAAGIIGAANAQAAGVNSVTEGIGSVAPLLVNKFSGRST